MGCFIEWRVQWLCFHVKPQCHCVSRVAGREFVLEVDETGVPRTPAREMALAKQQAAVRKAMVEVARKGLVRACISHQGAEFAVLDVNTEGEKECHPERIGQRRSCSLLRRARRVRTAYLPFNRPFIASPMASPTSM
jgi:hypothetical protein